MASRGMALELACCLEFDEAGDDVGIAFTWAAEGREFVDDVRFEPDKALAVLVGVAFETLSSGPSHRRAYMRQD